MDDEHKPESLSYNPSNQGLKLAIIIGTLTALVVFILQSIKPRVETWEGHARINELFPVFILQSIKPRVETVFWFHQRRRPKRLYPTIHQTKGWNRTASCQTASLSLSYNPSNQGLKLPATHQLPLQEPGLYPTIHQTKGWNLSHSACTYLFL